MAGPQGPIGPWLSHKLYSTVNITSIFYMKAAIDCSHHELHGNIQINFFLMVMQLVILGVLYSFVKWISREIIKNKFLSEVIKRET